MRKAFLVLLTFILSGCAARSPSLIKGDQIIGQIPLGFSSKEVKNVLGQGVVIGYKRAGEDTKEFVPITLKNPYRIDILKTADRRTFEVVFYLTRIKHADGRITDDELVPFIFEDDRLVGKGWNFLERLKKDRLN
jgi:hypothetical protein